MSWAASLVVRDGGGEEWRRSLNRQGWGAWWDADDLTEPDIHHLLLLDDPSAEILHFESPSECCPVRAVGVRGMGHV